MPVNAPFPGPRHISCGQATVSTAVTPLTPYDLTRDSGLITNTGSVTVFLGNNDVTAATGYPLTAGATLKLANVAAFFAVTASGTSQVGWINETD